jgi:hypothetical protein
LGEALVEAGYEVVLVEIDDDHPDLLTGASPSDLAGLAWSVVVFR